MFRGWRKIARDTEAWKLLLQEVRSYMDSRAIADEKRYDDVDWIQLYEVKVQ